MTIARLQNYLLLSAAIIFAVCIIVDVEQQSLAGLWSLFEWVTVIGVVLMSYSFGQPGLSMFRLIGSSKGTMPIYYYWVFAAAEIFTISSRIYFAYARPHRTLAGTSQLANVLVASVMTLIVITLVIAGWTRLRSSVNAVC